MTRGWGGGGCGAYEGIKERDGSVIAQTMTYNVVI
jgi:hypothetical protein